MKNLSEVKQSFLGGLTALILTLSIFAASVVNAQEVLNPEDASLDSEQSGVGETLPVLAPDAVDSSTSQLIIFVTSTTYNGAGPAGYGRSGMHAACQAEDPASHFCTIQEIENAWKTRGVLFSSSTQSWIDNAVVGTINDDFTGDISLSSDWYGGYATGDYPYNCNAWTSSSVDGRGIIINSGAISWASESCDDIHPISCCK